MTTEEYIAAQRKWSRINKIRKGSKVRVCCSAISGERGWGDGWTSSMDRYIGCVGSVVGTDVHRRYGIKVRFDDGSKWNFPYFVLEKVEE